MVTMTLGALGLLVLVAIGCTLALPFWWNTGTRDHDLGFSVLGLGFYAAFLTSAWIQFRGHLRPFWSSLFPRQGTNPLRVSWFLGIVGAVVFGSLSLAVADGFVRQTWFPWGLESPSSFSPTDPLTLVSVVIAAPVVEEIVFRGYLLHRLSRWWGPTWGVLVTSAVFAALHPNPAGHFLFAVTLALLVIKTRSLTAAVAVHGANNLLAVSAALVASQLPDSEAVNLTSAEGTLGLAMAMVVLGGFGWAFWRYWPRPRSTTIRTVPWGTPEPQGPPPRKASAEIVLCCGKVCSGKSTYARQLEKEHGHFRFSADAWMLHFYEPTEDRQLFDHRLALCEAMIREQAVKLLARGINVVLDHGFWTERDRQENKRYFEERGFVVRLEFFPVDLQTQVERSLKRSQEDKEAHYAFDEATIRALNAFWEEPV